MRCGRSARLRPRGLRLCLLEEKLRFVDNEGERQRRRGRGRGDGASGREGYAWRTLFVRKASRGRRWSRSEATAHAHLKFHRSSCTFPRAILPTCLEHLHLSSSPSRHHFPHHTTHRIPLEHSADLDKRVNFDSGLLHWHRVTRPAAPPFPVIPQSRCESQRIGLPENTASDNADR